MIKEKVMRTERFIQFGEGGFLRGFADWMIQKLNDTTDFEGSVVVVQPIEKGMCDQLTAQDCIYTHIIRGEEGVEKQIVDVISRCDAQIEERKRQIQNLENIKRQCQGRLADIASSGTRSVLATEEAAGL